MDKEVSNTISSEKKSFPKEIENSPYFWGDLSEKEATSFLTLFPTNKNMALFRKSSAPGYITTTFIIAGQIKNIRVPYILNNNGECLISIDNNRRQVTFEQLISYTTVETKYTVLHHAKDLNARKLSIQPFSDIKDHPYCWNVPLREAKKILNDISINYAEKDFVIILPSTKKEDCMIVYFLYNYNYECTHHVLFNKDDSGNHHFSIIAHINNPKPIISDVTFDQLVSKYSEWGFTVLSWNDALNFIESSKMTHNETTIPTSYLDSSVVQMLAQEAPQIPAPVAQHSSTALPPFYVNLLEHHSPLLFTNTNQSNTILLQNTHPNQNQNSQNLSSFS